MNERLRDLKKQHEAIPIPEELNMMVKTAVQQRKVRRTTLRALAGAAAAIVIFVGSVNASPALAAAMSEVPVIGSLVKVVTIQELSHQGETTEAHIKTPAVTQLNSPELEETLNSKYLADSKKRFEDFKDEVAELEKSGGAHMGLDSGYEVLADTDRLLTLSRYVVTTAASAAETRTYDTIDKQKKLVITLPSLFKDDGYIQVISENIKQQMRAQMKADPNKSYWLDQPEDDPVKDFDQIAKDQNFYITADHKLVISFDEYEVAPGYMGVVEFTIPAEALSEVLVSSEYIK